MNNYKRREISSTASSVVRRSKIGEILKDPCNPILSEAFSYLRVVSIVDKKIVCKDWEDRGQRAANQKGRRVKRIFSENSELRLEIRRYCEGDPSDIEEITEEFGYPIGAWDVSRVEDFSWAFAFMYLFNEDIGEWNVGNGTNMKGMFLRAKSFDQNLSWWNVSGVRNMCMMFHDAYSFNGDVSTWSTSKLTTMKEMFHGANGFDGDVSTWDTSNVTNMGGMFWDARKFNGDVSSWDTSNVTNMKRMFKNAWLFNGDVSSWDTSSVTRMGGMFRSTNNFNDLSKWDPFNATILNSFKFYDKEDASGAIVWP